MDIMKDIKKKYSEILRNLEENIENPKDLQYAKEQVIKLANIFLDAMDKITKDANERIEKLAENHKELEIKMAELEKNVREIEKDIYDIDDGYDLEVICPYCDYEFTIEEDTEKTEVQCPECGNTIEIDWEGDSFESGCSGHCSSCESQCGEEKDEDDDM